MNINNATYLLLRHEFPLYMWGDLAVSLSLGSATQEIRGKPLDCLVLLIERWLATFHDIKWKDLIEAIRMSGQYVVANSLAKELGIKQTAADCR